MSDLRVVREKLLDSIDRWQPEMNNTSARSTLQHGIVEKCYSLLDRMLKICTVEALALTGDSGDKAVKSCCRGKPPSRMTLGERVQVLETLDLELGRALRPRMAPGRARVLGKRGIDLLVSIAKKRNLFAHESGDLNNNEVSESLAKAAEFCKLDLVTMIVAVQEARNTGDEFTK